MKRIFLTNCFRSGALAAALALAAPAPAQTDNFNSGALGPGWATSISSNFPGTITFPGDPYGGKAIRMVADYSAVVTGDPVQDGSGQNNPRLIAWRTDRQYGTFYVAVDVLKWGSFNNNKATNAPLIALIARLRHVIRDPNVPIGRPDCMVMYLNYNRFGTSDPNGITGTRGVINIGHLTDGGQGTVLDTLGVQGEFTLDPSRSYRMVFTGTNTSSSDSVYCGRVYDLQDLTRPLVTLVCPNPFPGVAAWETAGYSGIGSMSDGTTRATDVTFDNFVAAEFPPTAVSFPGTTNGEAALPQVINRVPSSWTNFYPAAGGITFTATTLGGSDVTAIKLFLNGFDFSSRLVLGGAANSRTVSLPGSFLSPNLVYEGRIELANSLGQKTTNVWTFDTFSDAYLAATNYCKVIECEDFDFGGGQFIENPVPSGWVTNVTSYNNFVAESLPWTGAINQDTATPPFTSYVNKGTAATDWGVDYYDNDGKDKQPYEADFRPLFSTNANHSPGTSQGCPSYMVMDVSGAWFPGQQGQNMMRVHDTQRKKYSDVDPALMEYVVGRIEGGDWYNYTRTFNSGIYYNVYLRAGAEYYLPLALSRISATTNRLGGFYTANSLGSCNLRYLPLVVPSAPPNSLIQNGNFEANAASFTVWPGYIGGGNPATVTGWTDVGNQGGYGINGVGATVGDPFSPASRSGLTYLFIQGGDPTSGHALSQPLPGLAPNTTYALTYSVAGRLANDSSYRVAVYADSTLAAAYYDSGVQPAVSDRLTTVTVTFTTPATPGAAPQIRLGNWSGAGDNTVVFANVFLVPAGSSLATSKPAVLNFAGQTKLRLLADFPQEERTKQGLMLNYLAFVPALMVETSSQASSGYALNTAASVEPVTRTITLPQSAAAQYYRLRWDHPVKITSATVAGEQVVLTYE